VNSSVSLAEKFPNLESLTVNLLYFATDRLGKTGEVTYRVNVRHAKSAFSFVCPSGECMDGDFDLSEAVSQAVTGRRRTAEGEIRCRGFHSRGREERVPCCNLLRYKLTLGYGRAGSSLHRAEPVASCGG
jgi:hypothetical protein